MVINHSFFGFILASGPMVKLVLALLLIASLISWTIIFQRGLLYRRLRRASQQFENKFWSDNEMSKLYTGIAKQAEHGGSGMAMIFEAGFKEYVRNKQQGLSPEKNLESIERAMAISYTKEQDKLDQHLPILATIGSTSPYVGLFGTVWGIMTAFQALGQAQQATIAMVAPGIAEALIATAIGLFTAIPAVVAYNRYIHSAERLGNAYAAFKEEFIGIIYRKLYLTNEQPGSLSR